MPQSNWIFVWAGVMMLGASVCSGRYMANESGSNSRLATLGEFPSKVVLRGRDGRFVCSGTLIGDRHVLTAAHCVINQEDDKVVLPETLQVMAGDLSINASNPSPNREERLVSKIIVHNQYTDVEINHDLAILVVSQPFRPVTGVIAPAPLSQTSPRVGAKCLLGKWDSYLMSPDLQRFELEVIEKQYCLDHKKDMKGSNWFCVGKRASCQDITGDEIICDGIVAGLASLSFDCKSKIYSGVYIDLASYNDWIKTVIATGEQPASSPSTSEPGKSSSIYPSLVLVLFLTCLIKY